MLYPIELLGHGGRQHGSDHQLVCHVHTTPICRCVVNAGPRLLTGAISHEDAIQKAARPTLHLARIQLEDLAIRMAKPTDKHASY